jgi:hypothetical protein
MDYYPKDIKTYIFKNYNEPICYKYHCEHRYRPMHGDKREFDRANIIILYKHCDLYYIDIGEYYEYGDNEDTSHWYSFGIHMDVIQKINMETNTDMYLLFVQKVNSGACPIGNGVDIEILEPDEINAGQDWKQIIIDGVNYSCRIYHNIYFINDNEKNKYLIACCNYYKKSIMSITS